MLSHAMEASPPQSGEITWNCLKHHKSCHKSQNSLRYVTLRHGVMNQLPTKISVPLWLLSAQNWVNLLHRAIAPSPGSACFSFRWMLLVDDHLPPPISTFGIHKPPFYGNETCGNQWLHNQNQWWCGHHVITGSAAPHHPPPPVASATRNRAGLMDLATSIQLIETTPLL